MPKVQNVLDYLKYLKGQGGRQYSDSGLLGREEFQEPSVLVSPEGSIGIYVTQMGFWEPNHENSDEENSSGVIPNVQSLFHVCGDHKELKNFLSAYIAIDDYPGSLSISIFIEIIKHLCKMTTERKLGEIDYLGRTKVQHYTGKRGRTKWEPEYSAWTLINTNLDQEKIVLPYMYSNLDFECDYYFFGYDDYK